MIPPDAWEEVQHQPWWYINPVTATTIPLTPFMMKEWSHAMVSSILASCWCIYWSNTTQVWWYCNSEQPTKHSIFQSSKSQVITQSTEPPCIFKLSQDLCTVSLCKKESQVKSRKVNKKSTFFDFLLTFCWLFLTKSHFSWLYLTFFLLCFHQTMDRITPFCLIFPYLDLPPPYLTQIHWTAIFPISYPLSPHIFDRPWRYLVALRLSPYQSSGFYLVQYIDPLSSVL